MLLYRGSATTFPFLPCFLAQLLLYYQFLRLPWCWMPYSGTYPHRLLLFCVHSSARWLELSGLGSPARAGTVCPRFHLMFTLMHFPIRASACSLQCIDYYLHSQYYSRSTSYSHITQLLPWLTGTVFVSAGEIFSFPSADSASA
jgi:hypothetical protein